MQQSWEQRDMDEELIDNVNDFDEEAVDCDDCVHLQYVHYSVFKI